MTEHNQEEIKNLTIILSRQTDVLNDLVQKLKSVKNSEANVPENLVLLKTLRDEMDFNTFTLQTLDVVIARIERTGQ